MVTAFLMTKILVFKGSTRPVQLSFLIFTAVNVISVVQTWSVSILLARYILPWLEVKCIHSKFLMALVSRPVIVSYYAHKYWTFK